MSKFFLTPAAWDDLEAIWRYIARDSQFHADRVEEAILETCRSAAAIPNLGHRRQEVEEPTILFLTVSRYPRYSIAYVADSQPLQVVRVIHGARDIPKLFRP